MLTPRDTMLVGRWELVGGEVRADDVCRLIDQLTSTVLQKLATSRAGGSWETLYRDPRDGRLWERVYPQGHMQGGGPPTLRTLAETEARARYDF